MGNKESKPTVLPYEEAVRRVSDEELKRLRDAFKRYSLPSGFMSRPVFVKDVLGDCVPVKLGEHLYYAFGGTSKGIVFKELLSGLVLLTKGTQIEKIKFIFQLCASETGMHVNRDDLQKFIVACDGGPVPIEVKKLFRGTEHVSYEQFCSWLLNHTGVMKISSWLLEDTQHQGLRLSDDGDTPTFYQTLAGVTHLEEVDIIELEKKYWMLQAQSKTGRFDLETFTPLISPPVPRDLCKGLFYAFDENHDEHIDLKEMACGLSACCRGPLAERQKFCFKIFDKNHDGLLDRQELESMCTSLVNIRKELRIGMEIDYEKIERLNPLAIAADILAAHDGDGDGSITPEEYQMWTVKSSLPDEFCNLLFEVCHIVLGLRPASREEEKQIVLGWIDREKRRGLQMGTTWYLIAIDWWRLWYKYVNYNPKNANHATMPQVKSNTLPRNIHSNAQAWSAKAGGSPNFPRRSTGLKTDSRSSLSGLSPTSSPRRLGGFSPTGSPRNSANHSPRKGGLESGVPVVPMKPGPINNTPLIVQDPKKVPVLTNEGGRLKRSLNPIIGREFEIIPDPVWKALYQWYAGGPILPRNVITPTKGDKAPHLELYPLNVKLLRHQSNTPKQGNVAIGGLSIGSGGISWNNSSSANNATTAPKRYLAYTASFSKMHTMQQVHEFLCARLRVRVEEMRLWSLKDENNPVLLEDEPVVLEQLKIVDDQQMLIEIRNKDLSWPEEMSLLAKNKQDKHKQVHTENGVTGLSNLGNTCFLNSALQCISNTQPLTMYFKSECYLYELNSTNPLGMKGHIARRYGELVNDLWAGNAKSIAPLKLRWTIAKYAPRFNGFQQQDSQELLAFLLDGLHEDLNRVHDKPYVELKDSDSRPDEEVAKEAWENHLRRNKSIVVDLFHGQLKSQVRCKNCGHVSVRFDPFTFLSLPLPMDSSMHVEIIVVKLDGSVPIKYGLRLNMDDKYRVFKGKLSELCNIPSDQLLLVEIGGAMIRGFPSESQKIRTLLSGILYAYEVPPPPPDALSSKVSPDVTTPTQIGLPTSPSTALPPINTTTNSDSTSISATQSPSDSPTPTPKNIQVASQAKPNGSIHQNKPNGKVPGVASSNTPVRQHSRNPSNASSVGQSPTQSQPLEWTVIAMHRKMMRMDVYFLGWQKSRPALFGTPIILSNHECVTNCELYEEVWTQVKRLVSSPPPSEVAAGNKNHAEDGSRQFYPYTLKAVQKDGLTCAWCPWYRFCRGCEIVCDSLKFNHGTAYIAVDWEPTALHLRYQSSQERVVKDHESVEKSHKLQTEPIDLDECLRAFTKEEELGEDELYYCSKCKEHRLAAKKLEIWRLPPILIVHMKRFQFVNGRWVKSQKIVKFPKEEFDPSNFLADRDIPQTPLLPVTPKKLPPENGIMDTVHKTDNINSANDESADLNSVHTGENGHAMESPTEKTSIPQHISAEGDAEGTEINGATSGSENNAIKVEKHNLEDLKMRPSPTHSFSSDHSNDSKPGNLSPPVDATNDHPLIFNLPPEAANGGDPEKPNCPMYDLFAVSCHTGILGGGHYVSYAINPNKKWYCFNDSSVKEVKGDIDTDHAYLLFYERKDLPYRCFIPDISGKTPDRSPIDDEIEADYKKFCVIQ
ncbi:ubiquitin carboxyl-terminal hydrolase 32-like isoform X2 [Antedon mediterranea]|uniref:ubiquitin carboxyl-terminal hydrolase 32-like isoform X2 n=1 Tax=Antedon mediterranea TaxID=105859 RepID=UPI003AF995A0